MKLFGLSITRNKALQTVPGSSRGWWSVVKEAFAGAWQSDAKVTQTDLLASPVVYACITKIANDVGKLRARVVRKDANGIWQEAEPLQALHQPNAYQNHIQFKQWWVASKMRSGNAYALKERDASGNVHRLHVLQPEHVTVLVAEDGSVFYQLGADNLAGVGHQVTVPASEVIHDRMNCLYHPLVGISPLHAAAIAAGIGIKIQSNTLEFFTNKAQPGGILIAPGALSKETADAMKAQWQQGYTGQNAGKVAVLGDGLKFEPMTRNAVDSQLIETLKWSDERVCTVFHVPAHKVGVGAAPTFNNIEALDRSYYADCLQILIEEMEACLDAGLGFDGLTAGIELDLSGLMRMDTKTQMETLTMGVDKGVLTINGARKALNLPPLPGGDTVYMQQQDFPLDQVRHNKLPDSTPETTQEVEA